MEKDEDNLGTLPGPSTPRFPLPRNTTPSSPPASPPRGHQQSNSISESLSEGVSKFQSTIEKSLLLESNVLRAYPPAVPPGTSRRKVTPPQPRLVVPPSPPESFIASGPRQYRSASTGTSGTVRTLPPQEEESDAPALISQLKGRLNKALIMRRGYHSRKSSEVEKSPGSALTPSTANTTSPQSTLDSAVTSNLSAITTAHSSLYLHTFPIPDIVPEAKSGEGSTDSGSSYGLPAYYTEDIGSKHTSQGAFDRLSNVPIRNSTTTNRDEDEHSNIVISGAEVRVEIKRPDGSDIGHRESLDNGRRGVGSVGAFSGRGSAGDDKGKAGTSEVKTITGQETPQTTHALRHQPRGFLILRDPTAVRQRHLNLEAGNNSSSSLGNGSKNSEQYAEETVQYFEGSGFGGTIRKGIKGALPVSESQEFGNSTGSESEPALPCSRLSEDKALSMATSASPTSMVQRPRPALPGRNQSSSSSSILYSSSGLRPSPIRLPTSHSLPSINSTSASINVNAAEGLVRCMSVELGKRLSALSSSGSTSSHSGLDGLGAGMAVVVTTDNDGEINDVKGHLLSIGDEGDDEEHSSGRYDGSNLGDMDKGKGKAVSDQGETSIEESQTSSNSDKQDDSMTTSSDLSEKHLQPVPGVRLGDEMRVHPGDERYNFVYRVRSASPDNQPILIPMYKAPRQSSFPYCNALVSALPQKSRLPQKTSPSITIADSSGTLHSSDVAPSHSVHPAKDRLLGHQKNLKGQKSDLFPQTSPNRPLATPGDGPEDTSASNVDSGDSSNAAYSNVATKGSSSEEQDTDKSVPFSLAEMHTTVFNERSEDSSFFILNNPDRFLDNSIADTKNTGFDQTRRTDKSSSLRGTKSDNIQSSPPVNMLKLALLQRAPIEHESSLPVASPGRESQISAQESVYSKRSSRGQESTFERSESMEDVLNTYRRALYGKQSKNLALETAATGSANQFRRRSNERSTLEATTGSSHILGASPSLAIDNSNFDLEMGIAPEARQARVHHLAEPDPSSLIRSPYLQQPQPSSQQSLREVDSLRSRLDSVEVFEEDHQPLRAQVRVFDPPPCLVKKFYPAHAEASVVPAAPMDPTRASPDPEFVRLQKRFSRVLLFLCFLFPPMLLVLASGGLDNTMLNLTQGKVDHVRVLEKRVGFFAGAFIGSACCSASVVLGILVAKGLL
ncbi:hypothetical protein BDZ91DRAFT_556882 [Kalaharituber pfeilii]|nr:hypothetical protein BDZ91DRAFT_556882 [Kalaharituber pfeilii]